MSIDAVSLRANVLESYQKRYRENATAGSILYPMIALWAALLDLDELYHRVAWFKAEHLAHCNFQFWYPDENSETHLYTNTDSHGATVSNVCVERSKDDFVAEVFRECEHSADFEDLSAVNSGLWPLIIVACRHHRLPFPLHLLKTFQKEIKDVENEASEPVA